MTLWSYAFGGFLVGTALIGGVIYVGDSLGAPASSLEPAGMMSSQMPATTRSSMAMPAGAAGAATQAARLVTIVHARQGCHVWSLPGAPQTATMRLNVKVGTTLTVRNMDVDNQALRQMAGPRVGFDRMPMRMRHSTSLTFAKPGTYRFATRSSEGMVDMPTAGPDNHLLMTVVVG